MAQLDHFRARSFSGALIFVHHTVISPCFAFIIEIISAYIISLASTQSVSFRSKGLERQGCSASVPEL